MSELAQYLARVAASIESAELNGLNSPNSLISYLSAISSFPQPPVNSKEWNTALNILDQLASMTLTFNPFGELSDVDIDILVRSCRTKPMGATIKERLQSVGFKVL